MLSGIIRDLAVYISFKLNQQYIVENLCVEKDLKVNTCNGSCDLTKQLLEVQKEDAEPGNRAPKSDTEERVFVTEKLFMTLAQPTDQNKEKYIFTNEAVLVQGYSRGVFKPPQA